ncbi:MAG TPA: phosphoribosylanthranilate isomerase [Candidatus Didemnitutus sp.]
MIGDITVKVCGVTRREDAEAAAGIGADYLGFNFYEKSPRHLTLDRYQEFAADLPALKKVAVVVEPDAIALNRLAGLDMDFLQVHFRPETNVAQSIAGLASWGPRRLWFAPRLAPGAQLQADWLQWSAAILLDTYDPEKFGGTGRTGDWNHFRTYHEQHPNRTWILSGGIGPANVRAALAATGADFIDVNSGVESSPGLKDPVRLRALADAMIR